MESNRVSLSDIAAHAGISPATVSRVLSGAVHPISEKTKARVYASAEELGYIPNAIARALATNESRLVGVIVGDITDHYFSKIIKGVEHVATERGYSTVICNGDRSAGRELEYFRALQSHSAAAIIFAGGYYTDNAFRPDLIRAVSAARKGPRVVCLADRGIPGVSIVAVDSKAVIRDLTSYMIRLGHRRIAFVGGPPGYSISNDMQSGYEEAVKNANLEQHYLVAGGYNLETGIAAANRLLQEGLSDAVITGSDDTAIGIITTLQRAGIRVPEHISVAGVDDGKYSELMGLTTVRLPGYDLGVAGARVALGLQECPTTHLAIPHIFVQRHTTTWAQRPSSD
jgi:LacI family transcriptional regulator